MSSSVDQSDRRKRKRVSAKLIKRRLKEDAFPSIFKNLPNYYTSKSTPARSGLAASSSRYENAAARLEKQYENFVNADKLENFDDFL